MKALIFVVLGCAIGVASASAPETCTQQEVDTVRKVIDQQANAIRMLKAQFQQQQRTIEDLNRRLFNAMQRQRA